MKTSYLSKQDGSVEKMKDPYEYEGYGSTGHSKHQGQRTNRHDFNTRINEWTVLGMFTILEMLKSYWIDNKKITKQRYDYNDLFIKDQNFKA